MLKRQISEISELRYQRSICKVTLFHSLFVDPYLCRLLTRYNHVCLSDSTPTCWVLWGNGSSVEHCPVLGDGPHLIGSADGDGLEGLVGAHMEPGAAL